MSAQHSVTLCLIPLPSLPSLPSLPHSLLVWPTEGNSYSLVITGRMMCALKCALPAWLPLRGPTGATEDGHREGPRMGWGQRDDGRALWVRGRWIMVVITRERFDQISSIVPCKWVSGEGSVRQWSWVGVTVEGREGDGGGRDRWRGVETAIWDWWLRWLHTHFTHFTVARQKKW